MKRTIGLAVLLVILYLYAIQSGFVEQSNDTVITEESYPTEIVEVAEVVETKGIAKYLPYIPNV